MSNLDAWLDSQFPHVSSLKTNFNDAAIHGKLFWYLIYRLRYFFILSYLQFIIQFTEYVFFYKQFYFKFQPHSILLVSLFGFIMNFLASGFEEIRFKSPDDPSKEMIENALGKYRIVSLQLILFSVFTLGIAYFVFRQFLHTLGTSTVIFSLMAATRILLHIYYKPFHVAVISQVRFFRPFKLLLLMEVQSTLMTLALFPFLGHIGYIVAFSVSLLCEYAFNLLYVKKSISQLGIKIQGLKWHDIIKSDFFAQVGLRFWTFATVLSLLRIGNLLPLFFLSDRGNGGLLIITFIFAPLFNACVGWPHILLFDLLKYSSAKIRHIVLPLVIALYRYSLAISMLYSLPLLGLGFFFLPSSLRTLLLVFSMFFFLKPLLTLSQIIALSLQKFLPLLILSTCGIAIYGLLLVTQEHMTTFQKFFLISSFWIFLLVVVVRFLTRNSSISTKSQPEMPLLCATRSFCDFVILANNMRKLNPECNIYHLETDQSLSKRFLTNLLNWGDNSYRVIVWRSSKLKMLIMVVRIDGQGFDQNTVKQGIVVCLAGNIRKFSRISPNFEAGLSVLGKSLLAAHLEPLQMESLKGGIKLCKFEFLNAHRYTKIIDINPNFQILDHLKYAKSSVRVYDANSRVSSVFTMYQQKIISICRIPVAPNSRINCANYLISEMMLLAHLQKIKLHPGGS